MTSFLTVLNLIINYLIACLINYEKYNKGSFKKDFTGGGGKWYPKMMTNGDMGERGVQKLPFLR